MNWVRVTTIVAADQKDAANTLQWVLKRTRNEGDAYQTANYTLNGEEYLISSGLWPKNVLLKLSDPEFVSSREKPEDVDQEVWDTRQARLQAAQDATVIRQWATAAYVEDAEGNKTLRPQTQLQSFVAKKAGVGQIIMIVGKDAKSYLDAIGMVPVPVDP